MTLADFHARVGREIKRGSAYTAEIPAMTQSAAKWMERNYSFNYMKKSVTGVIGGGSADISVPALFKEPIYVRVTEDSGQFRYLRQIDPEEVSEEGDELPVGFYLEDGVFKFDALPSTSVYAIKIGYYGYTDWPLDTTETPWLIENAEDVMLNQVMVYGSTTFRLADTLVAKYKALRDEALRTLLLAEERQNQSARSDSMGD